MRLDVKDCPFEGARGFLPGDVFDVGTPAAPNVRTITVILPVSHRDGTWTLYVSVP